MKKLLFLSLIWLSQLIYAQTIVGTVYDIETKETLMGASVYFEGTTIGVITDQEGKFSLPVTNSTSQVIVSYLGYQDAVLTSYSEKKTIEVLLVPKTESLSQVVINAHPPFTKQELLNAFRNQFLGTTKAGKSCKIVNEDILDLYYDTNKNELVVTADEIIRIENPYLGYEIRYRMYHFSIKYFSKSIAPLDQKQSFYAGTTFFIDKKKGEKKYENRRKKVYLGSNLHLMRTIAKKEWDTEKFEIYKGSFPVNPNTHFTISDTLGLKKIHTSKSFSVLFKRKKQSKVTLKYDSFMIDSFGNFTPADGLLFGGDMGQQRMGNTLPINYNYEKND